MADGCWLEGLARVPMDDGYCCEEHHWQDERLTCPGQVYQEVIGMLRICEFSIGRVNK